MTEPHAWVFGDDDPSVSAIIPPSAPLRAPDTDQAHLEVERLRQKLEAAEQRCSRLEHDVAEAMERAGQAGIAAGQVSQGAHQRVVAAERGRREILDVLRWYANPGTHSGPVRRRPIFTDGGARARKALANVDTEA